MKKILSFLATALILFNFSFATSFPFDGMTPGSMVWDPASQSTQMVELTGGLWFYPDLVEGSGGWLGLKDIPMEYILNLAPMLNTITGDIETNWNALMSVTTQDEAMLSGMAFLSGRVDTLANAPSSVNTGAIVSIINSINSRGEVRLS